jgi:hypothetical protein
MMLTVQNQTPVQVQLSASSSVAGTQLPQRLKSEKEVEKLKDQTLLAAKMRLH